MTNLGESVMTTTETGRAFVEITNSWEGAAARRSKERRVNRTMKKTVSLLLSLAMLFALLVPAASAAGTGLKLQKKYTVADYKEESYGVPPVVIDLDGDGKLEVLHGAYTLTVADAATGAIKWQVNGGKDRSSPYADYSNKAGMFCKFIVKDFNKDGKNEIALGYTDGSISLLNNQGYFMPGFPVSIPGARINALAADDVDGDGKAEIIAGVSGKGPASLYVYGCDGKLKPGWPQLTYNASENLDAWSYSYDIYNDGIATGDMDDDGVAEIVAPLDNYAVAAYNGDGSHVMVGSAFKVEGDHFNFGGKIPWIAVSLFEDYGEELRRANGGLGGWGLAYESLAEKGRKGTYGPGMTYATARFYDVDGDGTQEVLITAGVADRTVRIQNPQDINCFNITHTMYPTVYIYNGDHTRFNKNGYNWENIPTNLTASTLGKPLNQNPVGGDGYTRLLDGGVHSVPVVGDVNGDGVNEILFNAFDGKVHCFSAKDSSKELAGWPFTLPGNSSSGSYYEFPAEPTLADVNGDGKLEVVVVSWTETWSSKHPANPRTGQNGSIYLLDGSGKLLAQQKLDPMITYDNVSRSKPVVADIDGDKQMEILVSSSDFGGLIAYDVIGGAAAQQPTQPTQPTQKLATPNTQKVSINGGEVVEMKAYVVNNFNYVPVRDVAWYLTKALGEGSGVFDVKWDGAINLVTGQPYAEPDGKEGTDRFTGNQPYNQDPVTIKVNGQTVKLEYITLTNSNGGTTYYKLRDLGPVLGFELGYDEITKCATITTK